MRDRSAVGLWCFSWIARNPEISHTPYQRARGHRCRPSRPTVSLKNNLDPLWAGWRVLPRVVFICREGKTGGPMSSSRSCLVCIHHPKLPRTWLRSECFCTSTLYGLKSLWKDVVNIQGLMSDIDLRSFRVWVEVVRRQGCLRFAIRALWLAAGPSKYIHTILLPYYFGHSFYEYIGILLESFSHLQHISCSNLYLSLCRWLVLFESPTRMIFKCSKVAFIPIKYVSRSRNKTELKDYTSLLLVTSGGQLVIITIQSNERWVGVKSKLVSNLRARIHGCLQG